MKKIKKLLNGLMKSSIKIEKQMTSNVCPLTGETKSKLIFTYNEPPIGEVAYSSFMKQDYFRQVWKFFPSGHYVSTHAMTSNNFYEGDYVDATYKDLKSMQNTFNKITSLPKEKSDNYWRFEEILNFSNKWFKDESRPKLLDIGSGLGVFPFIVNKQNWDCTALDPDKRSIDLIKANLKIKTICADFMNYKSSKKYDIITLNKVLEHIENPIEMLLKTKDSINKNGFVYIEIPDGEIASLYGKGREEFFIEHLHVFSMASTAILASKAGFKVQNISRIQEPSSKFTIRAFLSL
ncbi:class I SAM-dependent methyltransferase [Flavobacteriaceae bacterium]|jgi:hypothetical protein|nr:class I SAM-dependent methyltransferase [Flavobacteriaceae bacterium]